MPKPTLKTVKNLGKRSKRQLSLGRLADKLSTWFDGENSRQFDFLLPACETAPALRTARMLAKHSEVICKLMGEFYGK